MKQADASNSNTRVASGAAWMVLAACLLATLSLLVRQVSGELHPFEIAFFRNIAQLLLMVPWLIVAGFAVMRTDRLWAHIRRSIFGILAMLSWFWVITKMPLAEATSISFSAPLFTTLGAALFLGEQVGPRRWLATFMGFVGVLVIIRPGFRDVGEVQLIAILCAVLIAGAMLSNKSLAKTENPNAMVVWMGFFMTLFSLPSAIPVWQWPSVETSAWLVVLGLVATAAHLALNRAFVRGDASFIAPFGFVQIPFIALMGYVFFAETPDTWTWVGAAIIVGSGIYTAHREAIHKNP
ncbi:MAG: hypothetical protein COB46_00660 [Rhodospirillaceae bacterium]|nr:MAG: hypothetical protein COB46_00660 [Rhodospirillaceae bacterium]